MPALIELCADRWINAEKLYGILHILSGLAIFYIPKLIAPTFYWVIFWL
jgi:NHS family xanthosine MFS transporter